MALVTEQISPRGDLLYPWLEQHRDCTFTKKQQSRVSLEARPYRPGTLARDRTRPHGAPRGCRLGALGFCPAVSLSTKGGVALILGVGAPRTC